MFPTRLHLGTILLMKLASYPIATQALWSTEPNFKSNKTLEYCQHPLLLCLLTCSLHRHLKVISCRASQAENGKNAKCLHNLANILKIRTSNCQFKVVDYWLWWSGRHTTQSSWYQHQNLFSLFLSVFPEPRTALWQRACAMCRCFALVGLKAPALCSA